MFLASQTLIFGFLTNTLRTQMISCIRDEKIYNNEEWYIAFWGVYIQKKL